MRPTENDDNILLLALGGTIAVHVIILVLLDVVQVTVKDPEREVAPRIEMVEVEIPKVKPPPPPPPAVQARVEPQPRPDPKPRIRTREPEIREPVRPPPPSDTPPAPDAGGAPVVKWDGDIAQGGKVPVAIGKRTTERVGRGGTGTGTGAGSGAGTETKVPPPPVSVATIKTRAMPKGDHSYFDAGRDYPAAARQAAIEGVIRVKLVVSAEGKVTSAALLNKLGYGLDELAIERAKKIEFEPAKDTDDKSVASIVIWTFNMTLPK